jgi:GDP-4-dehydro-6-deoxy-D-mannose reductase
MQRKKILITGANGFVASHFLDYLENQKIASDVLGIDIVDQTTSLPFKYIDFRYVKQNMLDLEKIDDIACNFQPDYVLHLASYSSVAYSWEYPVESFKNNMNIFLNLVETIRKHGLKTRILAVGSSEQYGNINATDLPLRETSKLDPLSPYAVARVSQEMLSKIYFSAYGQDIVMTRSFNHIGPGQSDRFVISSFIKQIVEKVKKGQPEITLKTGDITIVRDFLDVRDVVKSYWLLLEKGQSGEIYNVCSGVPHSLHQIIDIIADLLNVNIVCDVDSSLIRPNDNKVIVGSYEKLQTSTGWTPTYELKNSLADIVRYWENKLK